MTINQHLKWRLLLSIAISGLGYFAVVWAAFDYREVPASPGQWAIDVLALGLVLWMIRGFKARCPGCKHKFGAIVGYLSLKKGHCPYCGVSFNEPLPRTNQAVQDAERRSSRTDSTASGRLAAGHRVI